MDKSPPPPPIHGHLLDCLFLAGILYLSDYVAALETNQASSTSTSNELRHLCGNPRGAPGLLCTLHLASITLSPVQKLCEPNAQPIWPCMKWHCIFSNFNLVYSSFRTANCPLFGQICFRPVFMH